MGTAAIGVDIRLSGPIWILGPLQHGNLEVQVKTHPVDGMDNRFQLDCCTVDLPISI